MCDKEFLNKYLFHCVVLISKLVNLVGGDYGLQTPLGCASLRMLEVYNAFFTLKKLQNGLLLIADTIYDQQIHKYRWFYKLESPSIFQQIFPVQCVIL